MDERWLPIVGYEGFYEISDMGLVRSSERTGEYKGRWGIAKMRFPAKLYRLSTQAGGYQYLSLKLPNARSVKHLVHRLVMRAFTGEPPEGRFQVNHKDGDKKNNQLSNLEYCSCQENLLHLTRVLKRKIGGYGGVSKITLEQAEAALKDKRFLREIAEDLGISIQAVWALKHGKNWSHLARGAQQ